MTNDSPGQNNPVYGKVKNFLTELGEETVAEKDEEKYWKLDIRHGSTLVTLYHDKGRKYMSVVYPNSIQDREILNVINRWLMIRQGALTADLPFILPYHPR
jgi:hypothetical protein